MEKTLEIKTVKVAGVDIELERFYSTEEAQKLLNVSKDTLRRRSAEGRLKRSGSARLILYKGEDIISFIVNGMD